MIGTSLKVNSPIFGIPSRNNFAFFLWRHLCIRYLGITCYRKLVMRGFSREDFKSYLHILRAKEKKTWLSLIAVSHTKRIFVNCRVLACLESNGFIPFIAYLKIYFSKKNSTRTTLEFQLYYNLHVPMKNTTSMSFAEQSISLPSESYKNIRT